MIKGDYWIKSGRIQSVAGGYDKDQHNEIAHNFVAKKYVEDMISYARGLGINVFNYTIYQDKDPGSTVASLMNVLLKKLGKSEAVGVRELQRIFKIDEETFDALSEAEEAMVYVQKHFGWIAVREMNIELFGLDYDKGRILLRGLNRIFEREKLLGSESMKFTIFDHKTGRTIPVSYEDILDGNFFKAGRIPFGDDIRSEGVNLLKFSQWLQLQESAGGYEPLVTANAVLFPVIHNQKVIITQRAIEKMYELAAKGAIIWHEGEETEEVVDIFLQGQASNVPILAKLEKKSWEPKSPQKISQQRFRQGEMLTSIFGGNDETKQAQGILTHPYVTKLKNPTVLDALKAASNAPQSRWNDAENAWQAKFKGGWESFPQGWTVYSASPVSRQELEQLVNLAQEPNMQVFRTLLGQPATEQNLVKFLKIGRHQGFNKPYADQNARLSSLGQLQQQFNYERDSTLLALLQRKGGIFFAGADHVPNVMRLMQQSQD